MLLFFSFYDEFTKPAGDECTKAVITFSDWYYSQFDYDKKSKTYKKLHNGSKHMDIGKDKQLEFTNLLFLDVPEIKEINEDSHIVGFDMDGGSGYLITAGKKKSINWRKDGDFGKLIITDDNGSPVEMNVGKTYIAVAEANALSTS